MYMEINKLKDEMKQVKRGGDFNHQPHHMYENRERGF